MPQTQMMVMVFYGMAEGNNNTGIIVIIGKDIYNNATYTNYTSANNIHNFDNYNHNDKIYPDPFNNTDYYKGFNKQQFSNNNFNTKNNDNNKIDLDSCIIL